MAAIRQEQNQESVNAYLLMKIHANQDFQEKRFQKLEKQSEEDRQACTKQFNKLQKEN